MKNVELSFIQEMFDTIAPWYDFLNRFLSAGQDVYWRREMVEALGTPSDSATLDVAGGTCDVPLEIIGNRGPEARVVGVDFSPGMLLPGAEKIKKKGGGSRISLCAGNALALPVIKGFFDGVTIAFGIRNIRDRAGALEEFHGALKKGGRIAVLELSTPPKGLFRSIYLFYFKRLLPLIGGFFSKSSFAYTYLPDSVMNFPDPDSFAEIMRRAGFRNIRWKYMTLGIVTLHVADRGD